MILPFKMDFFKDKIKLQKSHVSEILIITSIKKIKNDIMSAIGSWHND